MDAVSRSNLAAVLRIQTARRKMELEMCKKLEEVKLRDEARWKEKVMRKKPVWQELQYSHEEDLAMRLQLRRDEEKLRNEEHKHRMQIMLGRVKQQPTLFERQSKLRNSKTREELLANLYKDLRNYSSNSSDVSDRKCIKTKDEAIQAHFEDFFDKEGEGAILKKSSSRKKIDECLCQCEN
nr:uncharacterized protein LOC111415065 [Onthophagus taurus]